MKHRSFWDLTALYSCVCVFYAIILPAPFIFGPPWFNGGEGWIIIGILCAAELAYVFITVSFLRRQYRRWMSQDMWRSDRCPEQEPTMDRPFIVHGEDVIEVKDGAYNLVICHVDTLLCREGFMPSYRYKESGIRHHGLVIHHGVTRRIYNQAKRQGLDHLKKNTLSIFAS